MSLCADDNIKKYQIFPYPAEGETFICGFCFTHRDYIHIIGGYNFKDLMKRKYEPAPKDLLIAHHIALKYNHGNLTHEIQDLPYSRIFGGTCAFSDISETAFIFGGIHERVGRRSDLNSFYVSNILVTHRFTDKMSPTRTFLMPMSVSHPKCRVFHCSSYDYDRNSIWIYGGGKIDENDDKLCLLNDLWQYQISTQLWISRPIRYRQISSKIGRSMVYFNNKLFVLGGNEKNTTKIHWLDLTDFDNLIWQAIDIPQSCRPKGMGCSLQIVHHPTLGPKILIIGGSQDDIYTTMAISLYIQVEPAPTGLLPLQIISFDPLRNLFEKVHVPQTIPNVSYNGTALKDNYLFLVGGLNHSETDRSYNQSVIVLDIFYFLDKTYKTFYRLPFDHPLKENDQFDEITFPKFEKYLQEEKEKMSHNDSFGYFHQIYMNHKKCPFPTEDFTLIRDQYCHTFILNERIKNKKLNFNEIPINYSTDFAYYLYTGMIQETGNFINSHKLIDFISFCLKTNFIRLICLEILQNLKNLSPQDILKISSLSIDGTTPLVDDPDYFLIKCLLFALLRHISKKKLDLDFNPSEVFLISDYLIPLLAHDYESFPEMDLPPFPQSTVFDQLILLYHNRQIECFDWILNLGDSQFSFSSEVLRKTKHEIVIAVLQLSLRNLVTSQDIFSAFCLINSSKSLEKVILNHLLDDSIDQIHHHLIKDDELKNLLVGFLPKIKHWILLKRCVEFIGYDCVNFFFDRKGNKIPINLAMVKLDDFSYLQVELSYNMVIILLFIMYTRLDLNTFKIDSKKGLLVETLFIVLSDYKFLIPSSFHAIYSRYIRRMYK